MSFHLKQGVRSLRNRGHLTQGAPFSQIPAHPRIRPGYERTRVLNPWVFANYGQPQRLRGYVSPVVFQSHASLPQSVYLGAVEDMNVPVPFVPTAPLVAGVDESITIMRRMYVLSVLSVAIGAAGLLFSLQKRAQR